MTRLRLHETLFHGVHQTSSRPESIFGGKLSIYVSLAEAARQEAFNLMCAEAETARANAIIGMRYDATEIVAGVTEVLAYGTAVVVERI